MHIHSEVIGQMLEELYDDYGREQDQAILQRNLDKAMAALTGKMAVQRIRNKLESRIKLPSNVTRFHRGRM